MIPVNQKIVNQSGGIDTRYGFSVKTENLGTLFHILRNQLYSDPILAVIRELSTNGFDSHIAAGKPDEPILISLPNELDCFFKIRDFGTGLSEDEIRDVFCSYGESTKRQSNDATGMLGLGCKSPFAYNDSFIVNSYKDGTLTSYNAYIDPSNRGDMAKMASIETTEGNGLEIVIPVKMADISKFRDKAFHLFSFFRIKPKFANITPDHQATFDAKCVRTPLYQGSNWMYLGDKSQSYAIMGNIPYPIDVNVFGDELSTEMREVVSSGIILNFNIGDLEFAASREALQYTPFTKKNLLATFERIKKELLDTISKDFSNCKTLWDAKCMYQEVSELYGKLYSLRSLIKSHVQFNGNRISNTYFSTNMYNNGDLSNSLYRKGNSYTYSRMYPDRVGRQDFHQIEVGKKVLVVFNDKNICNGILNRVVGLIESGKYEKVHVLKFADDKIKADWIKSTAFDGPIVMLSTLPKEPLSKYYPNLQNANISGFQNPKHVSSEFVFVPTPVNKKTGYSSVLNRSDYWEPENVDPANDTGVYVAIERFEFQNKMGYWQGGNNLANIVTTLKSCGITVPKIYGFKPSSTREAKNNPNMVLFWDWITKEVANYFTQHPNLEQEYVDFCYIHKNLMAAVHNIDALMNVPWTVNANSPWLKFIERAKAMNNKGKHNTFDRVKQLITVTEWQTKLKVTEEIVQTLVPTLEARYPMLFIASRCLGAWELKEKGTAKKVVDYVDLIDTANP